MRKFDTYTYGVKPGEKITIVVHLQGLAGNAAQVSKPFQSVAGTVDPTWEFTVPQTKPEVVYTAFAEVSFVQPPPNARADITVEGSSGGGSFSVFPILANSPDKDPGFTFWLDEGAGV